MDTALEQDIRPQPRSASSHLPQPSPWTSHVRTAFILGGVSMFATGLFVWNSADVLKYLTFLAIALITSAARVTSPSGTMRLSMTLVLLLFGLAEFSFSETVFMAGVATFLPGLLRQFRREVQPYLAFEAALTITATGCAALVFGSSAFDELGMHLVLRLLLAMLVLFVVESTTRIAVFASDHGLSFLKLWLSEVSWALPYYAGGALLGYGMTTMSKVLGWTTVVSSGPAIYLIFRAYRLYLQRLEDQKRHAEEMASLHLRTIEALALAIEAKDDTTADHLQRVQIYATELARELGLTPVEKEALLAASVLHDIGKLAVPEHIISKPGRLTPEEFEKMKVHPIVGAEILERVRFPYPVAPIVRAHHEKWDGTGYPAGIKGEDIPIGARILSVVDCLDALASDRQYRRALPLDQAMEVVRSESGKAFDPKIVEVLNRHHIEWEKMAKGATPPKKDKLSKDIKVELGESPAAGFEQAKAASTTSPDQQPVDFLHAIASARQEVQTLFEISQDLGSSLALDETLSLLSVRLRRIIPHHSLAVWLRDGEVLTPAYVNGEDYRLFSSLQIPMGQGLSGWVAENGKPIVNGNPMVESGYLNDPMIISTLRSAVAVPLNGNDRNIGVLTLYHGDRDAFSRDHLRILNAINTKIGLSIENTLRFKQAESCAAVDNLTSLPNARSLFVQLDAELARAKRSSEPVSVLALDLDGIKDINDRFGHMQGDRVLVQVAANLRSSCREYDFVARMGGDEFVIILPGMRPPDAQERIDHLRYLVAEAGTSAMHDQPLTISIGFASYPKDGADAESLLAEADRRMFQEKRDRRVGLLPPIRSPYLNKSVDSFASSSL
jgi:diguanylate cyclase (GGDEF)-like protein/putative nucleotidyltransferase with HDIG domain